MKKYISKVSKLMILILMSLSLIGCGAQEREVLQEQGNLQDQVNSQDQVDSEKIKSEKINSISTDKNVNDLLTKKVLQETKVKNKIKFKKTDEMVYATANVNIRSSYTTNMKNVISVLNKGKSIKRIGIQKEWSKILYQDNSYYIKSNYLTLQKPVVAVTVTTTPTSPDKNFVASLNLASEINQLVCVIGNGGSSCTVSFHIKDSKGKWKQQFSIAGDNGSKGISYNKREGDKKTPAGLYSFTLSFGIKADPGAILPYRKITDYDYWVDDVGSIYYNSWVNSKETPGEYSSEHLIDHNPSYNYALNISYNSDRIPGKGSAMFLHGYNGTGRTTGCIAISEKCMKTLIQTIDSSTKILIVPSSKDLSNY